MCLVRFQAPVRDEESESQRKARSRMMRQTRRSTQVCFDCCSCGSPEYWDQVLLSVEQKLLPGSDGPGTETTGRRSAAREQAHLLRLSKDIQGQIRKKIVEGNVRKDFLKL